MINHENAFFDIIIGRDAPRCKDMMLKSFDDVKPSKGIADEVLVLDDNPTIIKPSPGPGYKPNVSFLGHNICIIDEANRNKRTVH